MEVITEVYTELESLLPPTDRRAQASPCPSVVLSSLIR